MLSYIYADRDLLIELYCPYSSIVCYQVSVSPVRRYHYIDCSVKSSFKFGLAVIGKNTTLTVIINDKVVFLEKDLTVVCVKIEITVKLAGGIINIIASFAVPITIRARFR